MQINQNTLGSHSAFYDVTLNSCMFLFDLKVFYIFVSDRILEWLLDRMSAKTPWFNRNSQTFSKVFHIFKIPNSFHSCFFLYLSSVCQNFLEYSQHHRSLLRRRSSVFSFILLFLFFLCPPPKFTLVEWNRKNSRFLTFQECWTVNVFWFLLRHIFVWSLLTWWFIRWSRRLQEIFIRISYYWELNWIWEWLRF